MNINPRNHNNVPIDLKKPKVIGAYSLDKNRKFQNDFSQIKYLKIPNVVNMDLKAGNFVPKAPEYDSLERIKQLSEYFQANKHQVMKNNRINAHFVCFRGVLKNLLQTPYERNNVLIVRAVKFKGTIYLCLLPPDDAKDSSPNYHDPGYGFKFERHVLSDHPKESPRGPSETVYENEEFCVLMKTVLNNKIKILFGFETDGVISKNVVSTLDELRKCEFPELKTRKLHPNNSIGFHLSLGWWCQTHISAVEKIYVGMRGTDNVIRNITQYNIESLASSAGWSQNACLNFLSEFLSRIQIDMKSVDDPRTVFYYQWNPKGSVQHFTLTKKGNEVFFPENFIEFMNDVDNQNIK